MIDRDVPGLLLALVLAASAITGRVVDLATGAPVRNASVGAVRDASTPIAGTRSASDGSFRIEGIAAPVDLVVSAPGYTDTTLRAIAPGGEPVVVRLLPALAEAAGEEIVVAAERERIDESPTISSHRVERGVVDKTPGSLEDVTRAISLKPGIVQISEFAPVLFIRGGDAYQTYFFLDDVLIYNPFQPLGGGTIFNADLVENAEVYTGGQLASFPEALSGLISLRYKEPQTDRIHALAEASMISVNTRVEGGNEKVGWLLSARRSDYEPALYLLGAAAGEDEIAAPYFLDLFAKGTWNVGPRDTLSANVMFVENSLKGFTYSDEESGIEDELFFRDRQQLAWLKWTRILGSSTAVRTNVSRVADSLRANSTGTDPLAIDVDVVNDSLRSDLSFSPEEGTAWDSGVYLNRASFALAGTVGDFRRLQPGVAIGGDINIPLTDLFPERSFHVVGTYVQYKRTLRDRLTLQPGVRVTWNDATHEMNVGPRLNVAWRAGERHVLKGAWGIFNQPPFNPILLDPDFGNPGLRSERSIHYVSGYEGEPLGAGGPWFKAEVYYKDVFDQVMPQDFSTVDFENPDADDLEKLNDPFLNRGQSDAYGVELSMQRELPGRTRLEINYSWLKVETNNPLIERRRDRRFPPYQDQRHTMNAVFNWRPDQKWTLSATGRFGSGKPYTAVDSFRVEQDVTNDAGPRNVWVPDELGPLNGERYPTYARLDLRAERSWPWRKTRVTAYLEIINAQLRRNTEFVSYTAGNPDGQPPRPPERKDIMGLPTIPFVGARVEY